MGGVTLDARLILIRTSLKTVLPIDNSTKGREIIYFPAHRCFSPSPFYPRRLSEALGSSLIESSFHPSFDCQQTSAKSVRLAVGRSTLQISKIISSKRSSYKALESEVRSQVDHHHRGANKALTKVELILLCFDWRQRIRCLLFPYFPYPASLVLTRMIHSSKQIRILLWQSRVLEMW